MEMLLSLWLPVILSTIALFFASFVAWTVLPHHRPDYRRWPDEDALLTQVRESGAKPGEYAFPYCDHASMKDEAVMARYRQGPWGIVNVWPGQPNMPANMAKTIVYFLVVTVAIAYVGTRALPTGAAFGDVFQVVGTTGILAYAAGQICREIWFTRPLRAKLMDFLDGVAYGVITGLIFGWLWP